MNTEGSAVGKARLIISRLLMFSPLIALLALGGCSQVTKPVVGAISFTNANGVVQPPVGMVQHGTSIYLEVAVTNDPEALGVDWTITCSSSIPDGTLPVGTPDTSCGSFTPYHTMSGPVPNYPVPASAAIVTQYSAPQNVPKSGTVTIVAHATSLPANTSSLTLTVM